MIDRRTFFKRAAGAATLCVTTLPLGATFAAPVPPVTGSALASLNRVRLLGHVRKFAHSLAPEIFGEPADDITAKNVQSAFRSMFNLYEERGVLVASTLSSCIDFVVLDNSSSCFPTVKTTVLATFNCGTRMSLTYYVGAHGLAFDEKII